MCQPYLWMDSLSTRLSLLRLSVSEQADRDAKEPSISERPALKAADAEH